MEIEEFANRLVKLHMNKGKVSAREISTSIGQSPNYINGIENAKNFPSMKAFFCICEYFGITPRDFFDEELANPVKVNELLVIAKGLSDEQLDILITLAKGLKK